MGRPKDVEARKAIPKARHSGACQRLGALRRPMTGSREPGIHSHDRAYGFRTSQMCNCTTGMTNKKRDGIAPVAFQLS
jgi:hypothetical protein